MKKLSTLIRHFIYVILTLISIPSFANHLVGMDLFYTWVSGNTYKITLIAYGDCGSAATTPAFGALSTNAPEIYIYNGGTYISTITLTIQAPSSGVEVTPVCPADISLTQCTNTSFAIPGIKKFVYTALYTVAGPSSAWRFLFTGQLTGSSAGRALSITNIFTTPITFIQLVDTLNNTVTHNSSPTLTNVPTPFFCLDNADNYNPGAIDPDGDSLRFFLVSGQNGTTTLTAGGLVSYTGAYTPTAPLAVTSMTFDPYTGQIAFFPNLLQRSLVVYNIEEYHAGAFRGTSQREMTFLVQTCTNTPPTGIITGETSGTVPNTTHFQICQNSGSFSFHIDPTEADITNNITVSYAGLPPGSTFVITGNGTPTPHCIFTWTSTGTPPGSYTFFITFTDNNCPLAGTQTIAYTVTIVSQPTITDAILFPATCNSKAYVHILPGGGGSPWYVKVSLGIDTIQSFSGVTAAFNDSLAPGTYVLTIYSGLYGGCKGYTTITIAMPPPVTLAPTFINPTYCGLHDGSITLHNLIPGTTDTVKYYYGGVLQPPVVLVVSGGGTITLTGLGAGLYSVITVTYGYCVSNIAGPVTLTVPPFNMRALSFVNPSFCGICNGSVTLYGLRPGGIDTIYYTKGGVPQTPVPFIVPSDSTVTISGLCAGVYGNFIAHAGSSCISNTLGPATLTVPPFTMRALTHTDPAWCGICDGTVKLYGLHPGQTDSIYYTKSGIPQTPFVAVVLSDSTITITGMCAGIYGNFVAHAGGVCVSNSLGPVTLTVPPFTQRALSFTNPDYCGICNGTITIYGLHPGETDSVHYNFNGVAQTPVVHFVGADSMVVLSGLCAGVYDNIITHTGGVCVSNTLGPVTLTVPPFIMRALTWTNPDFCGICNGSITLYGLHPGQTDTISFSFNGTASTPIIAVIPADSQVHLTGLCFGLYDNFVARTGGVCISNSVGPANLTVPPFTMRAISFTNPTKCGFCDGSVRLYGLHPGQTDTIRYSFNGLAYPPLAYTIGADSTFSISGLCEGVYNNFVANTGGVCISNTLGPITLKAPPIIPQFSYELHKGCGGDTLVTTNLSWPASDLTYRWFFGDGDSSHATNPTHIYYHPGIDIVKLYITNTKCFDSTMQSVNMDNLIDAGFTSLPDSYVCQGKPMAFTNTTAGTRLTYNWYFGDGGNATSINATHTYKNTGAYNVILAVTNFVPCFDTARKSIAVDSISAISMTATDSAICGGTAITFSGIFEQSGLRKVIWGFGDGDSAINSNPATHVFPNSGGYKVFVEAVYRACPDTSVSRMFHVFSQPEVFIGADTSICPGSEPISLIDNVNAGKSGVKWVWNTGETTAGIKVVEPGVYYVRVTVNGCTVTDSITVNNDCYMDIPNAFTPNGDGINDFFFPRTTLTRGLTTFAMQIYNRWGQELFASDRLDGRGWDGRFNNVMQPEGVYIYIIEGTFKDGQKEHHKGNVTLLK
jgi:gliding motility-associated-like protein